MKIPDEAKQKEKKINRMSTIAVLVLMVSLATITYYIVKSGMEDFAQQAQLKTSDSVPLLTLHVWLAESNEEYERGKTSISPGERVFFKVSTQRPFHTALAVQTGEQAPAVVFKGAKIPPGPQRLFEKEDFVFYYEVDQIPTRFCLLYASDRDKLQREVFSVSSIWNDLQGARCVLVD